MTNAANRTDLADLSGLLERGADNLSALEHRVATQAAARHIANARVDLGRARAHLVAALREKVD